MQSTKINTKINVCRSPIDMMDDMINLIDMIYTIELITWGFFSLFSIFFRIIFLMCYFFCVDFLLQKWKYWWKWPINKNCKYHPYTLHNVIPVHITINTFIISIAFILTHLLEISSHTRGIKCITMLMHLPTHQQVILILYYHEYFILIQYLVKLHFSQGVSFIDRYVENNSVAVVFHIDISYLSYS